MKSAHETMSALATRLGIASMSDSENLDQLENVAEKVTEMKKSGASETHKHKAALMQYLLHCKMQGQSKEWIAAKLQSGLAMWLDAFHIAPDEILSHWDGGENPVSPEKQCRNCQKYTPAQVAPELAERGVTGYCGGFVGTPDMRIAVSAEFGCESYG
jgi:hypothetical protein